MDQHWIELERLLVSQQRAGTRIDSVVKVGDGKDDKIIVKGRMGDLKIVPCGYALRVGMRESGGYTTVHEAVAAAQTAAQALGLRTVSARYGHGKAPTTTLRSLVPKELPPVAAAVPSSRPVATATSPRPAEGTSEPQSPDAFVAFARDQLREILDVSGQVLYSGASTLRRGELYLLGLNPGGDPFDPRLMTIRQSLDGLLSDELVSAGVPKREWNSYVHATWKGRDTLQRRILWLLKELGLNPLGVAASNLVFPRSRDEQSLQYMSYADACWSVHERVLEIVQPRWVLTYGGTPYQFLAQRFGASEEVCFPAGHGNWECRSFDVAGRFRVVGVPHMSLYAIDHHPEVVDWVRHL